VNIIPLLCPDHNKMMGYLGVQPIMKQVIIDNKLNYISEYYHVWKCDNCGRSANRKKWQKELLPNCTVCKSVRTYRKICHECRKETIS
jgi:hypothetical protein